MAQFKTLQKPSNGELKDRGSKFIAYAQAIYSEEEAKKVIEQIRKDHHKARHVCYAYKIGVSQPQIRINDDGEPSGTGGQPILNYINKYDLNNVIIAVVRYFGGVLLGKGGLINAYGGAAENAIVSGKIIELSERCNLRFEAPYSFYPQIMQLLKQLDAQIINETYTNICQLKIQLTKDDLDKAIDSIEGFDGAKIDQIESV